MLDVRSKTLSDPKETETLKKIPLKEQKQRDNLVGAYNYMHTTPVAFKLRLRQRATVSNELPSFKQRHKRG